MRKVYSRREAYQAGVANGYAAALAAHTSIRDTELETWFERDRAHVELRDVVSGATIVECWDEDVTAMVVDGFLVIGRGDRALHESVFAYAKAQGLFPTRDILSSAALTLEETLRDEYEAETDEVSEAQPGYLALLAALETSQVIHDAYFQGVHVGVKKGIHERLKARR